MVRIGSGKTLCLLIILILKVKKMHIYTLKRGSPLLFIYISFAYLPCLVTYNIAEFRSMSNMNESEKCASMNEVNSANQNLSTQNAEVL